MMEFSEGTQIGKERFTVFIDREKWSVLENTDLTFCVFIEAVMDSHSKCISSQCSNTVLSPKMTGDK